MTPKEKNDLLHDFINFGEGETLDGQYVKGLYYEEECVEDYCNKKLEEQAKLYKKEIVCLKSDLCWCIGVLEGMEHLRAKELKQKYCGENK